MSVTVNISLPLSTIVTIQKASHDANAIDVISQTSVADAIVDAVKALPEQIEAKPPKKRRAPCESDDHLKLPERLKQARLQPGVSEAQTTALKKTPPAESESASCVWKPTQNPKYKSFQLFLKALTGKTITLEAHWGGDTTIRELRQLVYEKTGVPHDWQRLICGGKQLGGLPAPEDDWTDEKMALERKTLAEVKFQ